MHMPSRITPLLAILVLGACQGRSGLQVRTFALNHLEPAQAMELLEPYVRSSGSRIYQYAAASGDSAHKVGDASHGAITVRESEKNMRVIQSLLRDYDRAPEAVSFQFQVVEANDSGTVDPAVAGLDTLLRDVMRYTGYRLVAAGFAGGREHSSITQTLGEGTERYRLNADIEDVQTSAGDGSVQLSVRLDRPGNTEPMLRTSVSIPFGQTVVLGSAASTEKGRTLLLTVRPELGGTVTPLPTRRAGHRSRAPSAGT